jgi:DNA-binding XRE family transcriptional regulator
MPKPLTSQLTPASSSSTLPNERAKSLGISHSGNVRQAATPSRALTPEQSRHDRDLDSGNFEAAIRLLQSRLDAGLTQEQVAARVGEDPKTIGQRERGKVALGPLRQLVILERARDAKLKGTK